MGLRHLTGNVLFYVVDFLKNFSYIGTFVYANVINTHIHTSRDWGDDCRQSLQSKFAYNNTDDLYSAMAWPKPKAKALCFYSQLITVRLYKQKCFSPLDAVSRYTGTAHSTDSAC